MRAFPHPRTAALWSFGVCVLLRGECQAVVYNMLYIDCFYTTHTRLHVWRIYLPFSKQILSSHSETRLCNPQLQHPSSVSELKPSEPRILKQSSNLSGLSGSFCMSSLHLTLVRSSDRMRKGSAVLRSRVIGAVKKKNQD